MCPRRPVSASRPPLLRRGGVVAPSSGHVARSPRAYEWRSYPRDFDRPIGPGRLRSRPLAGFAGAVAGEVSMRLMRPPVTDRFCSQLTAIATRCPAAKTGIHDPSANEAPAAGAGPHATCGTSLRGRERPELGHRRERRPVEATQQEVFGQRAIVGDQWPGAREARHLVAGDPAQAGDQADPLRRACDPRRRACSSGRRRHPAGPGPTRSSPRRAEPATSSPACRRRCRPARRGSRPGERCWRTSGRGPGTRRCSGRTGSTPS